MQKTPCPVSDYIDYITNPENVWDPSKYLDKRRISGVTEKGVEIQFNYNYVIGNSYMIGTFGCMSPCKIEVFYRDLQGFQVTISINDNADWHESFTPGQKEEVKELLIRYANL